MMKQILSENGINFNDLEKEIFEIGCKYAQNMMVNILETIDQALVKERDKKTYRHKGKRKTTIKTMMDEVEIRILNGNGGWLDKKRTNRRNCSLPIGSILFK